MVVMNLVLIPSLHYLHVLEFPAIFPSNYIDASVLILTTRLRVP